MTQRRIQAIHSDQAPAAIGTYSQAVRAGNLVFLSGQIPLDPATMELVPGDVAAHTRRVFENLAAVAAAATGVLNTPSARCIEIQSLSFEQLNARGRSPRIQLHPAVQFRNRFQR